ncbi:MAG TPA: CBS domain-containing protein [Vicinamibacteria bacterium]|nr:CBS domain-containing protein [Vicinamibacteria bacterium]
MKIADVMSATYARIAPGASLRDAARAFSSTMASDLMVVDAQGAFVGVLSEGDLIRAALPRYEEILRDGGSLSDALEMFIDRGKALADKPIDAHVIKDALTVSPDDPLLKAASTMATKQIRRLPVVKGGQLLGTVSRADICRAVLGA